MVMIDDGDVGDDDYVLPSQLQFQSMVLDQLVKKVDIRLNVCYDRDPYHDEDWSLQLLVLNVMTMILQ